jgi:hypothetical protein
MARAKAPFHGIGSAFNRLKERIYFSIDEYLYEVVYDERSRRRFFGSQTYIGNMWSITTSHVSYMARPGAVPVVLKAESLEHLLSIVRRGKPPPRRKLGEDLIFRNDFRKWLIDTKQPLPAF